MRPDTGNSYGTIAVRCDICVETLAGVSLQLRIGVLSTFRLSGLADGIKQPQELRLCSYVTPYWDRHPYGCC